MLELGLNLGSLDDGENGEDNAVSFVERSERLVIKNKIFPLERYHLTEYSVWVS